MNKREVHLIGGTNWGRDDMDPGNDGFYLALCGRRDCTTLVGTNWIKEVSCGECLNVEARER